MEAGAEIDADPPRVVALVEPTFVVSFPRSGSNFLQNVLRASSGRAARSIYDDQRDAPGAFSLKSHAPTRAYLKDEARRLLDLDPTLSRKLILVRDPRDVMISFFEYTQHKKATRIGQRHFVGSYDFFLAAPIDPYCRRRAETSALSVIDAYRKWLRDWATISPSDNELVVRYEALVSQPQATFAQLFAHLGEPDFPFCVAWANESWSGVWHGAPDHLLLDQTYPGMRDHIAHFEYLLPFFRDPRYLRVDGRPLFMIYRPDKLPKCTAVVELFRELAEKAGLPGLHVVAYKQEHWEPSRYGFDSATYANQSILKAVRPPGRLERAYRKLRGRPEHTYEYADAIPHFHGPETLGRDHYPSIVPGWDNSPRCGRDATILRNSTPELFRRHVRNVLAQVEQHPDERRIVFVKSWNEWAEGNYMEPDLKHGTAYLEVLRDEVLGDHCRAPIEITSTAFADESSAAHFELHQPISQLVLERAYENAPETLLRLSELAEEGGIRNNAQVEAHRLSSESGTLLHASGDDPILFLPDISTGREALVLEVDITSPCETVLECFSPDEEGLYHSRLSSQVPLSKGRNRVYIQASVADAGEKASLRLDPGKDPGTYILHGLEIRGCNASDLLTAMHSEQQGGAAEIELARVAQ